jgi:spore germination protein GerM
VSVSPGQKAERVAIEALLAGPTAQERQDGYVSNFGEASRGVPFEVEIRGNGLGVVNFDKAIQSRAKAFVSNLDARQVVATLGQLQGVRRVLILIEGEPLCRALGEC